MKINKIFIFAVVLISGILTLSSCGSDDDYTKGPEVAADCAGLSFGNENIHNIEMDPDDPTSIDIQVYRSNTQSAGTYAIKVLNNPDGVFNVPESVTFAAGQEEAVVTVTFDDAEVGTSYTLEIGFDDADVNPYTNTKKMYAYTVTRIRWITCGSCTFTDYTFSESDDGDVAYDVPIQNVEGTNRYRIVQPFIAVYGGGDEGFTTDTGIKFTLNNDYTIDFVVGGNGILCEADQYSFCWVAQYVGKYCNLYCEDNYYEAEMLGLIGGEGYYTGFAFAFEWTTGWPGQK